MADSKLKFKILFRSTTSRTQLQNGTLQFSVNVLSDYSVLLGEENVCNVVTFIRRALLSEGF